MAVHGPLVAVPPLPCRECKRRFTPAKVAGSEGRHTERLCPRCTKLKKQAKANRKKEKKEKS